MELTFLLCQDNLEIQIHFVCCRFDYLLGGGNPRQFHVVNLALHALVTGIFVHVLRHVCHVPDVTSGLAALLFAVHPVHVEAVRRLIKDH